MQVKQSKAVEPEQVKQELWQGKQLFVLER
jgi:hypothetical protein